MGKKRDLSNFEHGMPWLLVPDGPVGVFHNLLSYWDFHAQPFLGFTKNGVKRDKQPVCGSPVGENAMLMLEVSREWAD